MLLLLPAQEASNFSTKSVRQCLVQLGRTQSDVHRTQHLVVHVESRLSVLTAGSLYAQLCLLQEKSPAGAEIDMARTP